MTATGRTVPTQIVDKNGKPTTVHKLPDDAKRGMDRLNSASGLLGRPKESLSGAELIEREAANQLDNVLYRFDRVVQEHSANIDKLVEQRDNGLIPSYADITRLAESSATINFASSMAKMASDLLEEGVQPSEILDKMKEIAERDIFAGRTASSTSVISNYMDNYSRDTKTELASYLKRKM